MTPDVITVTVNPGTVYAIAAVWAATRITVALIAWGKTVTAPARAKTAPKPGAE